eukprot:TRINITY_DN1196_c0_g1_i8.p2 TRINITY_DN1196_c0_g1~~TRINITY_DN1196_c0_g1_i8.p2  ORF type:complete len:633 (-),score=79.17 TRINITY_DN1196_c0_g1_i8:204-2009(-)
MDSQPYKRRGNMRLAAKRATQKIAELCKTTSHQLPTTRSRQFTKVSTGQKREREDDYQDLLQPELVEIGEKENEKLFKENKLKLKYYTQLDSKQKGQLNQPLKMTKLSSQQSSQIEKKENGNNKVDSKLVESQKNWKKINQNNINVKNEQLPPISEQMKAFFSNRMKQMELEIMCSAITQNENQENTENVSKIKKEFEFNDGTKNISQTNRYIQNTNKDYHILHPKQLQSKDNQTQNSSIEKQTQSNAGQEENIQIQNQKQFLEALKNSSVYVLGTDEAGRGPLAGPVVAAACHVPLHLEIPGIQDSKKIISEQKRSQIYDEIINHPEITYGVSIIEPSEIDQINILQASLKGMKEATVQLLAKFEKQQQDNSIQNSTLQVQQYLDKQRNIWSQNQQSQNQNQIKSQKEETFKVIKLPPQDEQNYRKENFVEKQKQQLNLFEMQNEKQFEPQDEQNYRKENFVEIQKQQLNLSKIQNQKQFESKMEQDSKEQQKKKFFLLVDGNFSPKQIAGIDQQNVRAVIQGDSVCYCIAAASIIAKVTRDKLMVDKYDKLFPEYGFKKHKGYPTKRHLQKLKQYGPCEIHRKCYGPVAQLLAQNQHQL